ncbi:MAG TPA: ATP-binding protein [Thermodesulfobacteriota bacterium]|nr:ATP-binding protein [Thermodesulfobacteriota bacterium]
MISLKNSPLYSFWTRTRFIPLYWKVLPIILGLFLIFCLEQNWIPNAVPIEILHRLYFLPIIMSGLLFGIRGGFASAVLVTLLMIPHWISGSDHPAFHGARADEIILFYAFGILIGALVDRERIESHRQKNQEHLNKMGEAAATVAHEIKNPIIAIGAHVKRIERTVSPEDPNRERLTIIFQECQRLETLLQDMIHFSRPLDLELSPLDINLTLREVLELLRPQAELSQISLTVQLDEAMPLVQADQVRLTQVFYNLILNALQASPPEQSILIQTRKHKGHIRVQVSDWGSGIPLETREKIFQPFFSTKKKGSGLGLPFCKKIIELHKGHLFFRPNKPSGTVFIVILPVVKKISLIHRVRQDKTNSR